MKWLVLAVALLDSTAAMAEQEKSTLIVCPLGEVSLWIKDSSAGSSFFTLVAKNGNRVGAKLQASSEGAQGDQNEYVLEFKSIDSLSHFRIAIPDLNERKIGTFRGKGQLHAQLGTKKMDIDGVPCMIKMK